MSGHSYVEVVKGLAGSDVDLVELLKGLLNPSHVSICKMLGEQIFVGRSYIAVVVDLRI
jgi:hypothetical protein